MSTTHPIIGDRVAWSDHWITRQGITSPIGAGNGLVVDHWRDATSGQRRVVVNPGPGRTHVSPALSACRIVATRCWSCDWPSDRHRATCNVLVAQRRNRAAAWHWTRVPNTWCGWTLIRDETAIGFAARIDKPTTTRTLHFWQPCGPNGAPLTDGPYTELNNARSVVERSSRLPPHRVGFAGTVLGATWQQRTAGAAPAAPAPVPVVLLQSAPIAA